MSLRPSPVLALGAVLALAAAGTPQTAREPREPGPFAWGPRTDDLGALAPPTPGFGGWRAEGPRAFVRDVPSFTGDPTRELVVGTEDARGRDVWSRVVVQVPKRAGDRPLRERPALLVLHASGESERAAFVATDLPFAASRRGWTVIAPFRGGRLATTSPRASLDDVLERVYERHPFDFRAVHVLALGEGLLEALELARSDGEGLRVASIVARPTLLNEEGPDPFAPLLGITAPVSGDAVSPARLPEPIATRPGLAVFLHASLAEPSPRPSERAFALEQALRAGGAFVVAHYGFVPAPDGPWTGLPLELAFDALAEHAEPAPATSAVAVLAQPYGVRADVRFEVAPSGIGASNAAALEVEHVDALRLDLAAAGLDPGAPLTLSVESRTGTPLALRLDGYAAPPAGVEGDAGELVWRHDRAERSLRIEVPALRGVGHLVVRP